MLKLPRTNVNWVDKQISLVTPLQWQSSKAAGNLRVANISFFFIHSKIKTGETAGHIYATMADMYLKFGQTCGMKLEAYRKYTFRIFEFQT
jgi:hypothetical protein